MEKTRILVWDLPLRMFHWLLAVSFAGAFLTAESERVRDLHVALGYTFAGLLAFRLVWGVVGSRYSRFASFAFGPRAVLRYLRTLLAGRPAHYTGHNPAGSWVIYAMILLGIVAATTGHAVYEDLGGRWLESLHEGVANAMLALVAVHVAGVAVGSLAHRENLAAAMLTGYKAGRASDAIGGTRWVTAVALVSIVMLAWGGVLELPSVSTGTADAAATRAGDRHHSSPGHRRAHDG